PTYYRVGRNGDQLLDELRKLKVSEAWIHEIMRRKIASERDKSRVRAKIDPEGMTKQLVSDVETELIGSGVPVDPHFIQHYSPLQQRIAFVPDGDLFSAIRAGKADVETGEIKCFTENGVKLKDETELEADFIVAATGFILNQLGDIEFIVNGRPVDWRDTVTYRGVMFTDLPNLAWVRGYSFYSWTLRVDLIAQLLVRMFRYMHEKGKSVVKIQIPNTLKGEEKQPWSDLGEFNPSYLKRAIHLYPKRDRKSTR